LDEAKKRIFEDFDFKKMEIFKNANIAKSSKE